ncbi:MAG TPA: GNAT family protein [Clostridium sp.]|uniref:GNAT family N-acetyltransferase n=1 Tax=Clostridium sp. TaxID=1506 RepID=UPI002F92CCD9
MAIVKLRQYSLSIGELVIESAQIKDSKEIITFIKQVESETKFLMREIGEYNKSVEDEIIFIENKRKSAKDVFLVAKVNGKVVGTLGFNTSPYSRYKHKGQFGISISEEFWNYGIGYNLIDTLINWADKEGFVKISLEVDSDNSRAINLYNKFKFVQEGILKYDKYLENGMYVDSIIMGRIKNENLL